nr:hypothetical protein Iba_chr07dCG8410 [Ipomoea batatas]GMD19092.1 hypothetical protein Iba_chr07eCG5290 [Ipomoea batatas]
MRQTFPPELVACRAVAMAAVIYISNKDCWSPKGMSCQHGYKANGACSEDQDSGSWTYAGTPTCMDTNTQRLTHCPFFQAHIVRKHSYGDLPD